MPDGSSELSGFQKQRRLKHTASRRWTGWARRFWWGGTQHSAPVLEQLNQKLEARSDTLRRRIAVYVEKRIQRAYPEAAQQQPTAVQKGNVDFLSAADLLWLFVIRAFRATWWRPCSAA